MSKEIPLQSEPTETSKKMPVENAEINAMYSASFAIEILLHDAETRLKHKNCTLGFDRKYRFNGIMDGLEKAKTFQEMLSEDFIKAWGDNIENHDMERELANSLARLLLLWYDRIMGYKGRDEAVMDFIKKTYPEDVINEDVLNKFYMK